MIITYNKNPLRTTIELDEREKKELWYKIKIQELEEIIFSAHYTAHSGKFDHAEVIEKIKKELDTDYWMREDSGQTQIDKRCDDMLAHYLEELASVHCGDCTCVACSCSKCHAEDMIGINTIKGAGKHSLYKIDSAFGKDNEKTLDEAIHSLENYDPKPGASSGWDKVGGWEQYVPRWKAEAAQAAKWLKKYRNIHFGE